MVFIAATLNYPGSPGGGGFSGDLFDLKKENMVGTFTTDIQSPNNIFAVFGELITYGSAVIGAVNGNFDTENGTIIDQHFATLMVTPGSPDETGYDAEVIAFADGVITGGTGDYDGASGTTSLYLRMWVDFDMVNLPLVKASSFLFEFD